MKKRIILFIGIIYGIFAYTQNVQDVTFLKEQLLKQDYLFHTLPRNKFNILIQNLLKKEDSIHIWDIENFLSHFKEINLKTIHQNEETSLKLKINNGKIYITSISKEYSYLLEKEIININNLNVKTLKKHLKKLFYLPHQNSVDIFIEKNLTKTSLLKYLNWIKKDSLLIKTKEFEGYIPVNDSNISLITNEKTMFKDLKNNEWFWSYGINYGKQVYVKFNKLLCTEHFNKLKDSLKWNNLKYARTFHIPIQDTYKSKKMIDLINKLHIKFSKKRYKKLIIDLRNNQVGTSYNLDIFLEHLKAIKKLQSKNRIYIITNKYTNFASISYILKIQKNWKPIIVGETVFGVSQDSNSFKIIQLPQSKINIKIPLEHQKEIEIKPNILVYQTIKQTKKGIDAYLNKCLE